MGIVDESEDVSVGKVDQRSHRSSLNNYGSGKVLVSAGKERKQIRPFVPIIQTTQIS